MHTSRDDQRPIRPIKPGKPWRSIEDVELATALGRSFNHLLAATPVAFEAAC